MRTLVAVLALGLALATPGLAQLQRLPPPGAKLGQVFGQQHQYPMIQINREVRRLAPGGVILDQNNRFILHNALPQQANVLYVLDNRGDISRIVILTPEEVARLQQSAQR